MDISTQRVLLAIPWNTNHKLSLLTIVPDENGFRRPLSISFAKGDDSVYLICHPGGPGEWRAQREAKTVHHSLEPTETNVRLSLHPSGVVNLRVGASQTRLRDATPTDLKEPILTIGLADTRRAPLVDVDEYAGLVGKGAGLPLGYAHPAEPLFLSVFRRSSEEALPSDPLVVADSNPLEFVLDLKGRPIRYHFCVWRGRGPLPSDMVIIPGAPDSGIPDLRDG